MKDFSDLIFQERKLCRRRHLVSQAQPPYHTRQMILDDLTSTAVPIVNMLNQPAQVCELLITPRMMIRASEHLSLMDRTRVVSIQVGFFQKVFRAERALVESVCVERAIACVAPGSSLVVVPD